MRCQKSQKLISSKFFPILFIIFSILKCWITQPRARRGRGEMRKNSNYWICFIFIKIYCFLLWKYCSKDHENIVRILIRKTIRHEFICQAYIMWLLLRMCLKEIYLIRQNSATRDGDIAPEENLFDITNFVSNQK